MLCGECKDGQGVTVLFDRCDSCDNLHAFLILLLSEYTLYSGTPLATIIGERNFVLCRGWPYLRDLFVHVGFSEVSFVEGWPLRLVPCTVQCLL